MTYYDGCVIFNCGSLVCLFPAHAGMIPAIDESIASLQAVPRTRVDDPEYWFAKLKYANCSPHTRG